MAASDELRIVSISSDGDATTLVWSSAPGEFYTVYWTDSLGENAFWRVAAVNVPSGGTNTVWSEGGSTSLMMSTLNGQTAASPPPACSARGGRPC